jgi:5'-methylthioadenosine phosphorylase
MTGATEARLFREGEICYATLNRVTDYDGWRDEGETVSVDLILENLRNNIGNAKALVRAAVAALPVEPGTACGCGEALRNTIVTDPALIPPETRKKIDLIAGRYLP